MERKWKRCHHLLVTLRESVARGFDLNFPTQQWPQLNTKKERSIFIHCYLTSLSPPSVIVSLPLCCLEWLAGSWGLWWEFNYVAVCVCMCVCVCVCVLVFGGCCPCLSLSSFLSLSTQCKQFHYLCRSSLAINIRCGYNQKKNKKKDYTMNVSILCKLSTRTIFQKTSRFVSLTHWNSRVTHETN